MTTASRSAQWWVILLIMSLPGWASALLAGEAKYQVQLVWGTDEPKSASADIKVLEPATRERLRQLRWKNYFVVKSETTPVSTKEATKVTLSDRCAVDLKELPNGHLEVRMHSIKPGSDAKQVASRTLPIKELQEGHLIIYAGDSKDRWDDAWLVIVGAEKPTPVK